MNAHIKDLENRMHVNRELVTPEKAALWLSTSPGNRNLRQHRVEAYRQAMLAGEWLENGDTICFYSDGGLQDGHHRLEACVKSGASFYTLVVRGLTKSAGLTKDTGAPRTNKDNLAFYENLAPEEAAIIDGLARHVIVHDQGWESWPQPGGNSMKFVTTLRVSEWLSHNKEAAIDSLHFSKNVVKRGNRMLPKKSVAAMHFLGVRQDEETACEFLSQVFLGHRIIPGSTEDHLRGILLSVAMGSRKMPPKQRMLTVAKCMRAVLAGRSIKHSSNAAFRPNSDAVPFFPVRGGES